MGRYCLKYRFDFYHPNYIDIDNKPSFEFDTKEQLLENEEIKRVTALDYHIRWEQITKDESPCESESPFATTSTLMHIAKNDENGEEEFYVKGFITPPLPKGWFPEWIE